MSVPESLVADRYRLVEMVGSGGMGVVWKAWDERLQRQVAVKQLRPLFGLSEADTKLANDRAMREARITARLHHRHAVSVFDVVDDDGRPCLIMQFVPCTTLADELRDHGPLAPERVALLGARIASALHAAHDLGIVHRDVKPGNVLLGEDGSTLISDFGISRALDDISLTSTGMVHGTPAYLAPEVARGEDATYRSDVFSLGATLYAATEGSPPFGSDANSIALLHRVAAGTVEPPQQSGPLAPLLLQMLSADPSARPSMSDVANRLEQLARSGDTVAPPAPEPTRQLPPTPARPTRMSFGSSSPASGSRAGWAGGGVPVAAAAAQGASSRDVRPDTFQMAPAVTPPVVPRTPVPPDEDEPGPGRGRRRAGVVALVLSLVAVAALALYLVPLLGRPDPGTVADPPAETSTSAPAEPTDASPEPTPEDTTSAAPPSDPQDEEEDEEDTPSPEATPTPTPTPEESEDTGGSPSAEDLQTAITSYYALVTEDTDETWPLMTSEYQNRTAGGQDSYEAFWDDIDRVETSDVTATPPDQVQATLTYYYDDGQVLVEPTSFRLVEEEGVLKIADSTVGSGR
ncbi:serine/threonine-protein kinase [Auraticoccus monumenti]|uniref:non-specific serine/threonine protein kinase n=1 Tax=Auraticoccus monumenti TaxID=675864 RepID=A0A1G6T5D4_9ACTN|nr:serine/threonine-protein kinase [Auraticoccus monumenti]SDD23746.1 Serine/threonine protein kinase [Auraticoccus monumenti]